MLKEAPRTKHFEQEFLGCISSNVGGYTRVATNFNQLGIEDAQPLAAVDHQQVGVSDEGERLVLTNPSDLWLGGSNGKTLESHRLTYHC